MRINFRPVVFAGLTLASACNARDAHLAESPASSVALTGGLNTSMIYVARTDSGVIAIDLGWWGHAKPMARALAKVGATTRDVTHVFITHSHRDHIAAWPDVRQAQFHMAAPETKRMTGTETHRGWMVRWAEWLNASELPDSSGIAMRSFSRDTSFVLGRDTLHAFLVPGHTAGSVVYLFRGVLFAGDAVTHSQLFGFKSAKAQFSDDPKLAAANLALLWRRLPLGQVRSLCTAHAECVAMTPELIKELGGR